jgi:hypothetical protein
MQPGNYESVPSPLLPECPSGNLSSQIPRNRYVAMPESVGNTVEKRHLEPAILAVLQMKLESVLFRGVQLVIAISIE